ncbi:MAG TPA: lamin tail domain-containing protein [Gaiellaceae bacterium]|nr:lamin tail domain-containing protein [Gaiellaceae bacterium]
MIAVAAAGVTRVEAATPTDLFISEYVEGTANNKALELFNGTGTPIDLTAGAYAIDVYVNGASTPTTTTLLTGSVADGDVFVVANPLADAAILAVTDQQSAAMNFNGNDAIVLRKGATILDVIGQIGVDPGLTGWGTEPTTTTGHTLSRKLTVTAGDADGSDVFEPAAEWNGLPADTFSGLGAHTIAAADGTVTAHVTIAQTAACIQLSDTSISFGVLPFGAVDRSATPDVTVTNCADSGEELFASGSDATAAGASWTLDNDFNQGTCGTIPPLGPDIYRLRILITSLPIVQLSHANTSVQTLTAGESSVHTIDIDTACPGSSGAGKTMSMQVNYTATAA